MDDYARGYADGFANRYGPASVLGKLREELAEVQKERDRLREETFLQERNFQVLRAQLANEHKRRVEAEDCWKAYVEARDREHKELEAERLAHTETKRKHAGIVEDLTNRLRGATRDAQTNFEIAAERGRERDEALRERDALKEQVRNAIEADKTDMRARDELRAALAETRRKALEEAAKACHMVPAESYEKTMPGWPGIYGPKGPIQMREDCARVIRALIHTPEEKPENG